MSRTPLRAAILAAAVLAFSPLAAASALAPLPAAVTEDGPVTWSVEPTPTSDGGRRAFTYDVDPGTQIQDSFLITNAGDTEAEFIIYATDAFNDPDTGNFSLLEHSATPTDLGAWITTADEKLTIGPGLQATVPFTLLIPSDATPGDHSAGVVASVLTETQQDGSTVLLEQRVGARMYLTVSGEAVPAVELQGLTSSFTPSLNPFAPGEVTISYDVRNTGNKRVDVTQAIQIQGLFGIPVGGAEPDAILDLLPRQLVHVTMRISGVAALLYAQSTVTLQPAEVGSVSADAGADAADSPEATASPTPTPTPEPTVTGTPTPGATEEPAQDAADESLEYEKVSEQTVTIAISWTLLVLILLILTAIFLVRRYVVGTRERMYAAIDEAAEAARLEAEETARAQAAAAEAERTAAAAEAEAAAKAAAKKPAGAKTAGAKASASKTTAPKATAAKPATKKATPSQAAPKGSGSKPAPKDAKER